MSYMLLNVVFSSDIKLGGDMYDYNLWDLAVIARVYSGECKSRW